MAKKLYKSFTINFFFFTVILANICFYFTLKRTTHRRSDLDIYAIIFNVFLVLMLLSIIKLMRKTPQYLQMSEEKLAAHFEAFSETQIERKNTKQGTLSTDQEFQLYLSNYGLRMCEQCYVIKAS